MGEVKRNPLRIALNENCLMLIPHILILHINLNTYVLNTSIFGVFISHIFNAKNRRHKFYYV